MQTHIASNNFAFIHTYPRAPPLIPIKRPPLGLLCLVLEPQGVPQAVSLQATTGGLGAPVLTGPTAFSYTYAVYSWNKKQIEKTTQSTPH